MKYSAALYCAVLFAASAAWAQSPNAPTVLINELTQAPIDSDTKKVVVFIHGWNPDGAPDPYAVSESPEWSDLKIQVEASLAGSDWSLVLYNWHEDASTGSISWDVPQDVQNAANAANNAYQNGISIASLLLASAPELRQVHMIAHSAGTWAAYNAALSLLANDPYVVVQITLLDPFIPNSVPFPLTPISFLYNSQIGDLSFSIYQDRTLRLENYYANDSFLHGWNAYPWGSWTGPTEGTQDTFTWDRASDANQEVDWGNLLVNPPGPNSATYLANYDWHSGPIQFYGDTVQANLGQGVASGLSGSGCPFTYNQVGWYSSLFSRRNALPQITTQPQYQTANPGNTVTLSVTASGPGSLSYQWYKNGSLIIGANNASYSFTASTDAPTPYVVRVSNSTGPVFSDKAVVSTYAAAAPTISSISPSALTTSNSPQLITIYGSNFKLSTDPNASMLIFHDPANNPYVRTPFNVTATSLQYNVTVQQAVGTWTVMVTNTSQAASSPKAFQVNAPTSSTGSLTVTIQPTGAVSAGGQWQVDGGSYHNNGDTVASLTPGSHTISCKGIAGYTTPASHSVSITGGVVASDTETYSVVTPTSYTLTLNNGGSMGYVVPSPFGTWNGSADVYTAGSVVQLAANADPGYHFVGWGGDLSGTANPVTTTMSGNKSISANFASGDPNMGTIIVTIQPPGATAAGVKWGWNQSDYRDSGTSFTTWAGGYFIVLHPVDGWISPVPSGLVPVTLTGGQTTNYTVTFTQDTTPGLLTVTLSPPDAVTGGARWHVNGGAAQGNGATVSLSPGTNYVVTFDAVSGWTSPLSQTVTVQRAQTVIAAGSYTPPAGQPVIGSVSPPLGSMGGGTLLTLGGANFTAPATVSVGGQPASNVGVSGPGVITCVTPATSTYGTAPVVLQTPGGTTTNLNGFAYGMTLGKKVSLVGSVGGSAFGVAVQGNYAYVGEGRSLLVLDISTPSSPSKVGKVVLPGVVMDVALFGQYAYVAALEGGLQVVKISNPAAPSICGFYSTTNQASAEAITILGGLAYVADSYAGLEIFDLGNPVVPVLLSSTNCGNAFAVKVKASGNGVLAYVSTSGSLCVVDVSQPSSPVLLGQTAVGDGGMSGSIALYGNSVIGPAPWGGGTIHMVDVSQPSAPKDMTLTTGDNGTGGYAQVAVAGNYLYAESEVSGIGFTVFSISGTNLTSVGRNGSVFSPGGFYQKMLISGSRAYVAAGGTGLQIVDVSNPSSPVSVAAFADSGLYGNYGAVGMTGNYLCVGAGDFKVFNVNQPSQPLLVGQLSGIGASKVVAGNGVACATANNNVIDVISIGAGSPQIVASIPSSAVYAVRLALAGSMLYAVGVNASSQARFVAVDVSNPLLPTVRGTEDFTSLGTGMAYAVAASGSKAVVGIYSYSSGIYSLHILDISNASAPVDHGSLTNVNAQGIRISADGNYAFVSDSLSTGLLVVNISNLSSPVVVTNVPMDSSTPTGLDIRGTEIFATTAKGLYVFDISNPSAPALARSYSVSYIFGGACAPSDSVGQARNIYLADSDGGIVTLKEDDIQAPSIYITNPTSSPVYTNATASLSLGGGSSDDTGVTRIAWSNSQGGGGEVGTPLDSWFVSGIRLLPGTNIVTVVAYDAAGNSGADVLTVIYPSTNQNQTITFPTIAGRTLGDAPVPLVAAASSGLPVTFSVVSGPASLTSSNVLTLTGAGTVTVQANQPGNGSFNPAPPVSVTFNVAKADQSIAFTPVPGKSAGDLPFALTATTSSGLPAYFAILSGPGLINSNIVTLVGAGTVTVVAWQPGNSNYNAAATVQRSFSVSKIPQTITFGTLSQQEFGDVPFPLNATASSGLPVSLEILSGPATLSGNIVALAGWGTVTVSASQPGNGTYSAAPNVVQSFFVVPPNNTIASPQRLSDGTFEFAFYGAVGSNYTLQASASLTDWTSLFSFACTNSPTVVLDTSATNYSRRFYRVVVP
jgi:hypothetical protein